MSGQIKDGGSAFPWHRNRQPQEAMNSITSDEGMSLRDYFAAKAMQSLVAVDDSDTWRDRADNAYRMADAMLAAREVKS